MNQDALQKTLATKTVWFYSRTKKRLWQKGENSGNFLLLKSIRLDCDNDTLLIKVKPLGPTCHIGAYSCFGAEKSSDAIRDLAMVIGERKSKLPLNSYTAFLFKKGVKKICAKIKEEAGEVIYAASRQTKKRLIEESVDLLYHWLVLLAAKGVSLGEIYQEIVRRRKN